MIKQERYIITQDTYALFSEIGGRDLRRDSRFREAAESYFKQIEYTLSASFGDTIKIDSYPEAEINEKLSEEVKSQMRSDPDCICICLDRFLLGEIETDKKYGERFFRFSICRTTDGKKVSRQNGLPFREQIDRIKAAVPEIDEKKVIVVDDGVFSGGTIREFVETASRNGLRLNVEKVLGFIGNKDPVFDDSFPPVEIIESVNNLFEWVDIRDFGPLGGKKLASSRSNNVTSSVPYLFPWSEGEGASLNTSSRLFTDSEKLITVFRDLVSEYEQSTGCSPLTFRQLVRAGFPLPTNTGKTIPITINDTVTGYLDRCLSVIEKEKGRVVYVFDMDGTLYQLDGENNGFGGSTLEKRVIKGAKRLIQFKESCGEGEAFCVLQKGLEDKVGLSAFLSGRYGITREEYFDEVWDIDPEGIVVNFACAVQTIKRIISDYPNRKIILLTAAPGKWANRVLDFLGLTDCFETVCSGESFRSKDGVFQTLAGRYSPENILSIGDQKETDIQPAAALGIAVIEIEKPEDILQVNDWEFKDTVKVRR